MALYTVTIEVRVAWWLRPYLWALETVSLAAGLEPDWDKVARVVQIAVRARVG